MTEEDHEFYEVLETPPNQILGSWVRDNVVPVLNKAPVGLTKLQQKLEKFLSQFDEIELFADWPADFEYFCWLLNSGPGERVNTPPLTMILRPDLSSRRSKIPHNALADAYAIRNSA